MLIESCHILGLSCLALISPSYVWASSASLDFTDSVIVTPPELERLERRAIAVLREEIQKRTGVQLSTSTEWPKSQQSVIAVGQTGQMKILANPYSNILENGQTLGKEGFRLSIKENAIFVSGNDPRGVLYGVGELLRTLRMKPDSITSPNDVYITTSPR